MKVLKLTLLLIFVISQPLLAQKKIKGVVYANGKPLSQAKVYLINHENNHVLTDQNGKFILALPENPSSAHPNKIYIFPPSHPVRYSWQFNPQLVDNTRLVKINVAIPKDTSLVESPELLADNTPNKRPTADDSVIASNTPKIDSSPASTPNKLPLEEPATKTIIAQPEPLPDASTSLVQNTPPPSFNPPVEKTSNENTGPKSLDEVISELKEVSKEIKGERKLIVEKHLKITNKLREITDALQNLNITQEQREKLLEIIDDLEQQLAENALAYAELEESKRNELDKLKEQLGNKESSLKDIQFFLKFLLLILVLIVITLIGIYLLAQRRKRQRDLLKAKNDQINEQNEKLIQQQTLINDHSRTIENQNKLLDLKNTQLTASIRYALNIQKSILPHSDTLKDTFEEHFVFYSPKDIVSGDFYWLHRNGTKSVLAVVDCTGHGVPGGFMSIIGDSLLNEIVNLKGIYQPSQIIQELHTGIVERLNQSETKGIDGMDLGICLIEHEHNGTRQVTYAGAKNSLYYYKDGSLQMLRGDRVSIGGFQAKNQEKKFTDETITLEYGDILYLTTDGFIDNPNSKRQRFGRRKFQSLLAACSHLPMDEQEEKIITAYEEHREEEEQRDDILVLGVKV